MASPPASDRPRLARSALRFLAVFLLLYAALYAAGEQLNRRTGHANPFFKIAMLPPQPMDWVVLGASHAMPLDFAAADARPPLAPGLRIVNLASPGTGPLYNRFVLERFLADHRAGGLLYVVDSFAFGSRAWNQDRFADSKLLARMPLDRRTAWLFAAYCWHDGVDWRAWLSYVSGFAKLNNRARWERDVWIGETQFDRVFRPSATADRQRIAYLYPQGAPAGAALDRSLASFESVIALARRHGMRVEVVKLPMPARFRSLLPEEAAFDARLRNVLRRWQLQLQDLSATLDQPKYYFDTDHLNRAGVTEVYGQLRPLLAGE